MLSPKEVNILLKVYRFVKKRQFRYGLNKKYAGDPEAVDGLIKRGLLRYKIVHGNVYLYPTREGLRVMNSIGE